MRSAASPFLPTSAGSIPKASLCVPRSRLPQGPTSAVSQHGKTSLKEIPFALPPKRHAQVPTGGPCWECSRCATMRGISSAQSVSPSMSVGSILWCALALCRGVRSSPFSTAMAGFWHRSGHYAIRPALQGAPAEFQMLGSALSGMADSVQDRDRRLREALAQKSILLREIHHRVKNNLQIVMSLLNLQAKQLQDSAAKD